MISSLQLYPLACKSSQSVDCQAFFGWPLLLLPYLYDVSCKLEFPLPYKATTTCGHLCLVHANTSELVTLSFNVILIMS